MRNRALMMKAVEDALRQCEGGIKDFKNHLDTPLPSPALLANQQKELRSKTTQLHNQCRASLNDLQNVFGEHDKPGGGGVKIPPHLLERGGQLEEEFNQLVVMAKERTTLIEDVASSWSEFSTGLDDFYGWLRTASAELSSLKAVEKFADQFTELEERLEVCDSLSLSFSFTLTLSSSFSPLHPSPSIHLPLSFPFFPSYIFELTVITCTNLYRC